MSFEDLLKKLVMRTIFSKAWSSAVKIQKVFRGYMDRKMYKFIQSERNKAASTLQRAFKRYRMFNLIPKALKFRKTSMILMIQRYLRGYKDFSKINKIIRAKHMKETFEYFTKLRREVVQEASSKLAFSFRKFIFRRNVRLREEDRLQRERMRELAQKVKNDALRRKFQTNSYK
jgi:hypothetical protein